MNRTQTVKTAVLAIAIAAGTVGAQRAVAQQPQADLSGDAAGDTKVVVLSKSDLPGGKEATTFMTEIPPGASTPRHYHLGQELAYVHWASNTSKTDIQRWLITVVTAKGYPIIIPVK
jgi:quercetin dioxygenase-like cupin family protein